jgi:hypothetical protein
MKRKVFLLSIGICMSISWVWIYGASTIHLISQILSDEPYYFDNTILYFLAFTIAPFVLNSYLNGLNEQVHSKLTSSILHGVKFTLLCVFDLLLLLLSFVFFFAFFDTFNIKSFSLDWLLLLIPLILFSSFIFLSRFLYSTNMKN